MHTGSMAGMRTEVQSKRILQAHTRTLLIQMNQTGMADDVSRYFVDV